MQSEERIELISKVNRESIISAECFVRLTKSKANRKYIYEEYKSKILDNLLYSPFTLYILENVNVIFAVFMFYLNHYE